MTNPSPLLYQDLMNLTLDSIDSELSFQILRASRVSLAYMNLRDPSGEHQHILNFADPFDSEP